MRMLRGICWCLLTLALVHCGGTSPAQSSATPPPPPPPPPVKQWVVVPTGRLLQPRDMHTATLLSDGRVLVIGGEAYLRSGPSQALASAEIYDPATRTFSPAGSLQVPRLGHCAVALPDGTVVVLGGWTLVNGNGAVLSQVEAWNPTTNTFTVLGSTLSPHPGGQAFLRRDGRIQVVGGYDSSAGVTSDTYRTEIFDPASGTSQYDFALTDVEDNAVLIPLDASRFMLLGGENGLGSWHQLDAAALYTTDGSLPNPSAGGTLPYPFTAGAGVNLPSGKVVVAGGHSYSLPATVNNTAGYIAEATVLDYKNLPSSMVTIKLTKGRKSHQALLFPDGTVGLVGGETFTGLIDTEFLDDIEVVDLGRSTSSILPARLSTPRTHHTLTALMDGTFLIVGGYHYDPSISDGYASTGSCDLLVFQ